MRNFKPLPIVALCLILTIVSLTGCVSASESGDWENKYENLQLENSILKTKIETTQSDVTYLRDALERLRVEYDTLKADYGIVKTDHAILKATFNQLQPDYDTLQANYDTLNADHITLKATFKQLQVDYDKLTADYDALKVLYEDAQNELSKYIKDLAYIQIFVAGYSDDADPESDGISLRTTFYNSKSEPITFQGIPVTVTIKLYGYRDFSLKENRELVYQEQTTIDYSSGFFGSKLRIPFENMKGYYRYGTAEVTVATPKQGSFQAMQDLLKLTPEP